MAFVTKLIILSTISGTPYVSLDKLIGAFIGRVFLEHMAALPTSFGAPVPAYTEPYSGFSIANMVNGGNRITRFTYNLCMPLIDDEFYIYLDLGLANVKLREFGTKGLTPVAILGFKHPIVNYGDRQAFVGGGVGTPELATIFVDVGFKRDGQEFATLRIGLLSSLALHFKHFDVAVAVNMTPMIMGRSPLPSNGLSLMLRF